MLSVEAVLSHMLSYRPDVRDPTDHRGTGSTLLPHMRKQGCIGVHWI